MELKGRILIKKKPPIKIPTIRRAIFAHRPLWLFVLLLMDYQY